MKTLVVLLLVVVTVCTGLPRDHTFTPRLEPLTGVNNTFLGHIIQEFGLDVSVELNKPNDNVVISPLSISALLSVLMMGSARQSYRELRHALRIPDSMDENDIHVGFQTLMETISANDPSLTLNVANALFLQRGAQINYEFTQKARNHYNSLASTLDFQRSSVQATQTINNWVKESTSGMIPELFKQPLSPKTSFVAVNTVFFDGKWLQPFDVSRTSEQDFDTGSEIIKIPMMSDTVFVKYINIPEFDAHMAAIPYKGERQAMYILLPRGSGTPQSLEQELSAEKLNSYIGNMTNVEMRLWLPRMRLTFRSSLKETLKKLHVGSLFNPVEADFSRLTPEKVWIDDVVHETVIEITEEGTKAAAATGLTDYRTGSSRTFIVNRPALFFIRDEATGVPLFWGRLVRPEALRS